ncbi:hypothetical protein OZX74_00690 [Bifidobacterium sp. ESL0798]|uniref:hypothetical protein n=1 Tax=Bifidobacterium sp. ESL0798 TaxID=2983235 RepID=UPI0023F66B53|nr:hypothetical protein [Bifidobacterium sp. ESL0798]WEV74120.1 hypothetical protein OZX74_00690 [Bifidobacterium sp. ESL0798]
MPYSDTIRGKIASLDHRASDINVERERMQRRLAGLQQLHAHVTDQSKAFENQHASRQLALQNLGQSMLENRSVERYLDMMNAQMMNNANHANAVDAFQQSLHRLEIQIEEAEAQIRDFGNALNNIAEERQYQQQQLNRAVAEEQWQQQQERLHEEARRRGEW